MSVHKNSLVKCFSSMPISAQWIIGSLSIYSVLSVVSDALCIIASQAFLDPDGFEFLAYIMTSTHGFFTGIGFLTGLVKNVEPFAYSGFHLIPFLLGGLVWVGVALLLAHLTRREASEHRRYKKAGMYLMKAALYLFCASLLVSIAASRYAFPSMTMIFLAGLFIPTACVGKLMEYIGKRKEAKFTA